MNAGWARVTVATALAIGSLSACTGPAAVSTETPTPSLSANPEPSPLATPLTDAELLALMPPEAAYPDVRGAIATAKFFLEQYAVMYQDGDTRIWMKLSSPDCNFCGAVIAEVTAESRDGDYESGGTISLDPSTVVANLNESDGFTYVDFEYVQEPSTIHHADGTEEASGAGSDGRIFLRMTLGASHWQVGGVEVRGD